MNSESLKILWRRGSLLESYYVQMTISILYHLKRLSHEIFGPVFWAARIYLGLNVDCLWFLNFNDASLIFYNYFKF
jgi:hypothetical protein